MRIIEQIKRKTVPFFKKNGRKNGRNPVRDWFILLAVFSVLNIASAIFSLHIFSEISEERGEDKSPQEIMATFSRDDLLAVLKKYERKKSVFDDILSGKADIPSVDPSQ